MNYRIAIPSFKRENQLKDKTLKLLEEIPNSIIDIFIENEIEHQRYNEVNPGYNYIITNTTGVKEKRNYIRKYYRFHTKEKYIISIDDDIESIKKGDCEVEDLNNFFSDAFELTNNKGFNYWGICCFDNPFFLKDSVTTNLKYICGGLNGLIIDRKKDLLQTTYNHYEDFHFSILHFIRDGGVVRFNNYCLKTKIMTPGGIVASYGGLENRKKDMEEAGFRFVDEYPKMARLIKKKRGYDLRLNHRAKSN